MASKKSNTQRFAEKAVKKSHPATLVLAVLFLIVGIVAGIIVSRQLTKNDTFVLRGESVVRLEIGENYVEEGVTIVSFGKDISDKVQYGGDADDLQTGEEGIYQIVYTVEDFRWGDFQRVRTVIIGNPEGAEEFVNG